MTMAVLLAAVVMAGEPTHHPGAPHPAVHHSDAKAMEHAQEQERKQMAQAMHRQMEYEQRLMHEQQKAVHEQMKAQIHAQSQGLHVPHPSTAAKGYAGRPYGSVTRPYYGGYHIGNHRSHHYRNHRTWPLPQDREQAALAHLKQSLDHVAIGHSSTSSQKLAIERALIRVVEVSRTPGLASIGRLAGHLGNALADRQSPTIDTATMALSLRAGVNAPLLIPADRVQAHTELQHALQNGQVRPAEIQTVLEALKTIEHQEQARR